MSTATLQTALFDEPAVVREEHKKQDRLGRGFFSHGGFTRGILFLAGLILYIGVLVAIVSTLLADLKGHPELGSLFTALSLIVGYLLMDWYRKQADITTLLNGYWNANSEVTIMLMDKEEEREIDDREVAYLLLGLYQIYNPVYFVQTMELFLRKHAAWDSGHHHHQYIRDFLSKYYKTPYLKGQWSVKGASPELVTYVQRKVFDRIKPYVIHEPTIFKEHMQLLYFLVLGVWGPITSWILFGYKLTMFFWPLVLYALFAPSWYRAWIGDPFDPLRPLTIAEHDLWWNKSWARIMKKEGWID